MAKLKPFLDKYEVILFDMDGVITSEQHYWNSAALTVYEMLESSCYFGSKDFDKLAASKNFKKIRETVFCRDKTIALLKDKGVNSNWDLGYVVVCVALILKTTSDFEAVYRYIETLGDNILYEYDKLAHLTAEATGRPFSWSRRLGELWTQQQKVFQQYYMGDDEIPGLIQSEVPLIDLDRLRVILSSLCQAGKQLGYGTGRPAVEVERPLVSWDVLHFFSQKRRVSYDTLFHAEARLSKMGRNVQLTKPHPYMFLQGLYGLDYPPEKLLEEDFDKSAIEKLLVVGDAGADILAAQAMGADFCAVLTGVSGKAARPYFESIGSTYILNSVEDMIIWDN